MVSQVLLIFKTTNSLTTINIYHDNRIINLKEMIFVSKSILLTNFEVVWTEFAAIINLPYKNNVQRAHLLWAFSHTHLHWQHLAHRKHTLSWILQKGMGWYSNKEETHMISWEIEMLPSKVVPLTEIQSE